jgi:AcrR family transcriptional regulator
MTTSAGDPGTTTPAAAAPRRGRPRSETARRAILAAAANLLIEEPPGAVTMDAVAARAGVSKATIYRWWSSKSRLALDALYAEWASPPGEDRDSGALREDVLGLVLPWVRELRRHPYGRLVAWLLLEAHTDPEFAEAYRERFVEPRRERMRRVLNRAAERGEMAPGTDVELTIDLIYGPLYHRLLHGHQPLNAAAAERLVDGVLAGLTPR